MGRQRSEIGRPFFMKSLTKHIITNVVLLWAFSPVSLANPIRFDDPKFVTLSDGRRVPYGQGVICSDECVTAESLPGGSRQWWIVPVMTTVVVCALLCRPVQPPTLIPNQPETPNTPNPTPRRNVPPRTEVPDRNTLELLGLGLAMCWAAIRLREKNA